jgi:hypothetical protein
VTKIAGSQAMRPLSDPLPEVEIEHTKGGGVGQYIQDGVEISPL